MAKYNTMNFKRLIKIKDSTSGEIDAASMSDSDIKSIAKKAYQQNKGQAYMDDLYGQVDEGYWEYLLKELRDNAQESGQTIYFSPSNCHAKTEEKRDFHDNKHWNTVFKIKGVEIESLDLTLTIIYGGDEWGFNSKNYGWQSLRKIKRYKEKLSK